MKDIHGERSAPGRIPVISPVLHCVAMTALVYLRTSFGFTLLRPRSIFFALSVAVTVLDYIAWHEPDIWREYGILCVFSGGAVVTYWLHFGVTFIRELYRHGEHDAYPGTSHLSRILGIFGISSPVAAMNVHLWLEPAFVLICAAVLRYEFQERPLSIWLLIVAPCMWCKEALNYWTEIRLGKIAEDITKDADERGKQLNADKSEAEAPQATRVAASKMKRNRTFSGPEERERRFAKILGITAPYDLEEAEANYQSRGQACHPESHGNAADSNAESTELKEAIEFFREKLK